MEISYKEELFQTPVVLEKVLEEPSDEHLLGAGRIVFSGCGTSLYIGWQLAELCLLKGRKALAIDAIRLWESPFPPQDGDIFVFISRSGYSQETILAMEKMHSLDATCFYIGCAPDSPLAYQCEYSRIIPYANEKLILESFSYYSQLLLGGICLGLDADLHIPDITASALEHGQKTAVSFLSSNPVPSRIISLGSSVYLPLLREMMLKDGEITQLPAECWGNLEFRHGPRSWADGTTLIHLIPGQATGIWDRKVAEELIGYGCPVLFYGEDAPLMSTPVKLEAAACSLAEIIAAGAFHTAVAAEIGCRLGTCPENLRHIVHNVFCL